MKTADKKPPTQRQQDLALLKKILAEIDRICFTQRLVVSAFSRKRTEQILSLIEKLAKRNDTALAVAVFVAQKRVVYENERLTKLHALLNNDEDHQRAEAIDVLKAMEQVQDNDDATREIHDFLKDHFNVRNRKNS